MKTSLDQIVNAVLYEGYILYPYRASSKKNQRERFTFGRVYPQLYSKNQNGAEPCVMQTECLFRMSDVPFGLNITVGFLQPVKREIGVLEKAVSRLPQNGDLKFQPVPQLEVKGKIFQAWMEAVERKISVTLLGTEPMEMPFKFPGCQEREPIYNERGDVAGVILRSQEPLKGTLEVAATALGNGVLKISARISNQSPVDPANLQVPEHVLQQTFASTHFTLETEAGEFVSLLETPTEFKAPAEECRNIGCWPVLIGNEKAHDHRAMLASPIILYDYPKIAPESSANFFDGTEIDEMLTLRVMTLTDEEKREMSVDEFSRRILERIPQGGAMTGENILKLHGAMRRVPPPAMQERGDEEFFNPPHPVRSVWVDGIELKAGDLVTIHPKHRADAMDIMLAGKTAVIEAIEQDAEEQIHVALVLADDPGFDFGLARQSGHRFFYGVDEVKPLKSEVHV